MPASSYREDRSVRPADELSAAVQEGKEQVRVRHAQRRIEGHARIVEEREPEALWQPIDEIWHLS